METVPLKQGLRMVEGGDQEGTLVLRSRVNDFFLPFRELNM